ncbi:LysR substrate-binding domain-containing protein [Sphingomonas sediminicola]|uniref:LysR substrate-binding domain-containing protein n=1 Tax=Sphingomonas sediminicola TaxID=386874 RepID=UPI003CEBCDA4
MMLMLARNLDLDLLRCFSIIVEEGGFTRAGVRLGRTQSTISLQVKRLEEQVGRTLFERSPRLLKLTPDGERLLGPARELLRLHDQTIANLLEPEVAGTVTLGVPEDFATAHLPNVLQQFAEAHPLIELEVTCDLTLNLLDRFKGGGFDLVLVKREPAAPIEGVRVWREALLWVAREGYRVRDGEVIPLVVSPEPCVYRKRATMALDAVGRPWRIAYTSTSLGGAQAAVKAGLGVTVLPREMIPKSLIAVPADAGLPELYETEVALLNRPNISSPARRLAEHIQDALERERRQ